VGRKRNRSAPDPSLRLNCGCARDDAVEIESTRPEFKLKHYLRSGSASSVKVARMIALGRSQQSLSKFSLKGGAAEPTQDEVFIDRTIILQSGHVGISLNQSFHGDFTAQHQFELRLRTGGGSPFHQIANRIRRESLG